MMENKKAISNNLIRIMKEEGFTVHCEEEFVYFKITSPKGQDYEIELSPKSDESFVKAMRIYVDDIDISQEAMSWLDENGHGTYGAPYDMRDVYNDMEWCIDRLDKLCFRLEEALKLNSLDSFDDKKFTIRRNDENITLTCEEFREFINLYHASIGRAYIKMYKKASKLNENELAKLDSLADNSNICIDIYYDVADLIYDVEFDTAKNCIDEFLYEE